MKPIVSLEFAFHRKIAKLKISTVANKLCYLRHIQKIHPFLAVLEVLERPSLRVFHHDQVPLSVLEDLPVLLFPRLLCHP